LCPELPAYLRFGVDKPHALELARAGVRSRRLVHVAEVAATSTTLPVRDWLADTDMRIWGPLFNGSPSELADLLYCMRARDARITSRVLAGEIVQVPLLLDPSAMAGPVEMKEVDEPSPPPLAAFRDGQLLGDVRANHHDDVSRLLAVGVPLTTWLADDLLMRIRTNDPTERTAWFATSDQ
jgi:hypothetical protein